MLAKLKRCAVLAVAGILYYTGILRLWIGLRHRFRGRWDVCVLGLHRVLTEEQQQEFNSLGGIVLREDTFVRILEFLTRHFSIVSLQVFLEGQKSGFAGSKPPCLLTFDDGWQDNFTTALPILKRAGAPAVIFAVTSLIGTADTFWVERLARIWKTDDKRRARIADSLRSTNTASGNMAFEEVVEQLKHMSAIRRGEILTPLFDMDEKASAVAEGDRMLTWDETAKLQKENVEIEGHTVTHPLLVYEDDETIERELCQCKDTLEQKLGKRVRAFAYPNGTWDQRVRRRVEEAGYDCAFVTRRGWYRLGSDRYAIPRIMVHEGMVTGPGGKFSPAILSLRLSELI